MEEREDIHGFRKWAVKIYDDADMILDAYLKFGLDFFESRKYNLKKIKAEYDSRKSEEYRMGFQVRSEVLNTFVLGIKEDKNYFKNRLQEIYNKLGIIKRVTQETIKDYYEVETHNGETPAKYTLKSYKC